ncbi:hypothetical protein ACFE04_013528 [Oxalis oulophora]
MYTLHPEFANSMNSFNFDQPQPQPQPSDQVVVNLVDDQPLTRSSSGSDSDGEISTYSSIKGDFSSAVYKFINDMLMEEDVDAKPCMFQNCLALQEAEKSFYDVLGQKYPGDQDLSHCSDLTGESCVDSYEAASNMADSFVIEYDSIGNFDSLLQVEKGHTGNGSRLRKVDQRDYDGDFVEEERKNKFSATATASTDDDWYSDLFDETLLCKNVNDESIQCPVYEPALQQNGKSARLKKHGSSGLKVDLSTLLTQCAQAVAGSDQRMANDLLRQIRQHSSTFGDATQRMSYYFANALEARLVGGRTPLYSPIVSYKTSAADIIKAYKVQVSVCPFRLLSNSLTNRTIAKMSKNRATIHIIDFGILYGFQWPCFIQRISKRPGGPPKIRITGIDFPLPGFRPAERVEETGHRLEKYCKRFNVPFEYKAIAQRWETIKLEDLNIKKEDFTVVSCLYRLKNLPDDTTVLKSPRDMVLRLIKSIKPNLFVHGVVNGAYNAPFFTTRFREALFYYSTMFDLYETNLTEEDEERLVIERDMMGKEIMNIIACEGLERIERPETYKQWQARNQRIGFRQVRFDGAVLKEVRKAFKTKYHEDYVLDEDGDWMLHGWKGRIVQALSCWKPVRDHY